MSANTRIDAAAGMPRAGGGVRDTRGVWFFRVPLAFAVWTEGFRVAEASGIELRVRVQLAGPPGAGSAPCHCGL